MEYCEEESGGVKKLKNPPLFIVILPWKRGGCYWHVKVKVVA